jgi:hypothetical protein
VQESAPNVAIGSTTRTGRPAFLFNWTSALPNCSVSYNTDSPSSGEIDGNFTSDCNPLTSEVSTKTSSSMTWQLLQLNPFHKACKAKRKLKVQKCKSHQTRSTLASFFPNLLPSQVPANQPLITTVFHPKRIINTDVVYDIPYTQTTIDSTTTIAYKRETKQKQCVKTKTGSDSHSNHKHCNPILQLNRILPKSVNPLCPTTKC